MMDMEEDHLIEFDEEDQDQQRIKRLEHSISILEFSDTFAPLEQLEIQLSDGKVRLSWLVAGALSEMIKDYLDHIDKSTIMEPVIIIPDLTVAEFSLFKRHLLNVEPIESCDIEVILKNLALMGSTKFRDLQSQSQANEKLNKKHKKVPSIISNSGYGRTTSRRQRQPSKTYSDDHYDEDFVEMDETTDEARNSSTVPCFYCPKEYSHLKARNRHMICEHLEECKRDKRLFPCTTCPAMFVSHLGKEKHVKRMHPQETIVSDFNDIRCPFFHSDRNVLDRFQKLKEFHAHIKEYHPDKDKSCIGCGADFTTSKDLEAHMQTHQVGQPESKAFFFCEHCGKVMLREYALVMHKRNEHPTVPQTLECRFCGKDFKNAKFLQNHEEKHKVGNIEENNFICQICGKNYNTRLNLNRHIRTLHQKIKDHQCPECGKKFVDSTRLKEHRWIHTDHKPHKCRFCDQTFRHKNHVKHHEAKIHGEKKEFECDLCSKTFCYAYELKNHKASHDNRKSKIVLETPNKTQPNVLQHDAELTRHIFECSICQKQFASIPSLRDHCSQHTQEELARGNSALSNENTFTINSAEEIRPETEHILLEVEGISAESADEDNEEQSFVIEYV